MRIRQRLTLVVLTVLLAACSATAPVPGQQAYHRRGDEIMVAGQLFHTGAPVVLWSDPGGYDAYRVERRFGPFDQSSWADSKDKLDTPNRYGLRGKGDWPEPTLNHIRGGGWTLHLLQQVVDQFVIHYDACGTSRQCFKVLHDKRDLSVHFMLDLDGTIYQTLDLKERAWHAGVANDRSIGIEIANVGAYPVRAKNPFDRWYTTDETGHTVITIPAKYGEGGIRTPCFVGRPIRDKPVVGEVHGKKLVQYDLTPQQYQSLIKLTAALCRIFPRLRCDVPRDAQGDILKDRTLTPRELANYHGLLGHYHISENKVDPGPAFQWKRVIKGARAILKQQ